MWLPKSLRRKTEAAAAIAEEFVKEETGEAQVIRHEAERELANLKAQRETIDSLLRKIDRRRALNDHFGNDLNVTFTKRGINGETAHD